MREKEPAKYGLRTLYLINVHSMLSLWGNRSELGRFFLSRIQLL